MGGGRWWPPGVCVVGDALLDVDWDGEVRRVCSDAPAPVLDTPAEHARPGGAALAACLAAASGARTTLVTALGSDPDARRLVALLADAQVEVVDLGLDGPTPIKLRLRADGQSIARVDRACSPVIEPGPWTAAADEAVAGADAVLVADYGRGLAARPEVTNIVQSTHRPVVWDPHPDGPDPPADVALVTPNVSEAYRIIGRAGPRPARLPEVVALATDTARLLRCPTAVTAGALGAVLATAVGPPAVVPATPVHGDVCGAGDRFVASATAALAMGRPLLYAVGQAVADAGAFVAGGGQGFRPRPPASSTTGVVAHPGGHADPPTQAGPLDGPDVVRRVGGVVVAAGGCFDVLHAGHVRLLDQARRLGDHLIVCLNSDDSVRRLKGAGRPLNGAADRAAVLESLGCVDGVVVFDEDTPVHALAAIRPHLFVKGADYEGADLEEEAVLAQWGGHVVLLPLLADRSTTRIITTAARAAG
jgi:D-beta-D-heptose 7-phosphate kinase/D-beta-D-heptose 1-phosphate adenosyltransferase